ncbi:MAG TPA: hypothetical protein EYQ06_03825, partial [Flavobacteriales bacterium]|nr:hypothetical protein [Flavobacteriales bacterium]
MAQVVYIGNGWIAEDSHIALTGAILVTYVIIGVLLNLIHLMLKKKIVSRFKNLIQSRLNNILIYRVKVNI